MSMKPSTRLGVLLVLFLLPVEARAQERVAVPDVTSETDEFMAHLLTEALREAVLDAESLRGAGALDPDWTLHAEIHRASADEDDRLVVRLRLIPEDEGRDERTVETTMSPDEPPANLRARARSFLDALFGTALTFRDARATAIPPIRGTPAIEPAPRAASDWPVVAGLSSVAVLAASIAVTIGAQARITDIANDPRWLDARLAFTATDSICDPSAVAFRPVSRDYLAATCTEADALEVTSAAAMAVGALSLVSIVTFFALDAAEDREQTRVTVGASRQAVDVAISGRF